MKRFQKRNRAGLVRERWIMAGTAVFVLTALTLTGLYVRDINQVGDDGYIVDLSERDDDQAVTTDDQLEDQADQAAGMPDQVVPSDDLDFDPYFQEANSSQVENIQPAANLPQSVKEQIGAAEIDIADSGLSEDTAGVGSTPQALSEAELFAEIASDNLEIGEAVMAAEPDAGSDIPAISTSTQSTPVFEDSDNLIWPITGNVLINYSMDKTVYFPTLQQYKYNPAIIIQASEGEIISAAAAGQVTKVYEDNEIGNAVTMDLGNGYEVTYGQLANVLVSEGSFVAAGDVIAEVASPTMYYSVEGANIYFQLTKDGNPVNPMSKLQ